MPFVVNYFMIELNTRVEDEKTYVGSYLPKKIVVNVTKGAIDF